MLTDYQLEQLAKRMGVDLAGIYFKDELPNRLQYNKGYIINMEDSLDDKGNDNEGSHWVCLYVKKYKNNKIEPIYMDSFGESPPEAVKKFIKNNTGLYLPHTDKNIQSLLNNACGWFCMAFLHWIHASQYKCEDLYVDVQRFLDMFDDLNTSIDFKKNEYMLLHFFRSGDSSKRTPIDNISDTHNIVEDDNRPDIEKVPIELKFVTK